MTQVSRRGGQPNRNRSIPRTEIDTLILTAQEAADLALAGDPADGYQVLLAGLARAREIEGEPWAEELVRQFAEHHSPP